MPFLYFLLKRLLQGVFVMIVISMIAFAIRDELGDPLRELVGESTSEEVREQLRDEMGLNDPFLTQYGRFIKNAVQGDFGDSYFFKKPALSVILKKFPATLELVIATTLLVILLSIPGGVYCAIFPHHALARFIMNASIIGISIPVFLTAIFCIYLFSVHLGWLPSYGRGDTVMLFGVWESNFFSVDGLAHLILPTLTLSSIMLPLFLRLIRAEMMEVLTTDYIRYARAKGLTRRRVYFTHAFKNTLLPVITVGGVQFATLLAYTILTEHVFQWPGMGFLFLEAVHRVDTPLIMAYLIVVGLIFVVVNTVVDIIYTFVNPAVRISTASS